MDIESKGFKYLKRFFPQISDAKLKEGIFIWPQLTKPLKEPAFKEKLSQKELRA